MIRLTRQLKLSIKELSGESITYSEKFMNWIDNNHSIERIRGFYNHIRQFLKNFTMFVRFSWNYRPWDYSFNIEIFVRLLEETGKSLRYNGWAVSHEKNARRCFTAAGLLRKAYIDISVNKTSLYLYKKYGFSFMKGYKIPKNKRMIEGMRKMSHDREDIAQAELQRDAWQYIHKYIQHMWD